MTILLFFLQFSLIISPHYPGPDFKIKMVEDGLQRNLNRGSFRQMPGTLTQSEVGNKEKVFGVYLDFRGFNAVFCSSLFHLTLSPEVVGSSPAAVPRCCYLRCSMEDLWEVKQG